jgi:hypothetical protein
MDLDLIKKTLNSATGVALKDYFIKRLDELRSIENIEEKNTEFEQAIELKAQKRAFNKLKEILQDIINFSDSTNPKDRRDSYAVDVEELTEK